MELLVAVLLIGILSAVAIGRYGRSVFAEFGSQAAVREFSLDLLTCQRMAIATGDDHLLSFTLDSGEVESYSIVRRTGSGDVVVEGPKTMSSDITATITAPATEMIFHFDGTASYAYQINVTGLNRSFRVEVVPVTGASSVTETTP